MPNFAFPPGAGGGTPSPGAIAVNPARVIYVQPQVWDPGANPNKYVNTLAQAMAKAALLVPTATDPATVYVYPGTYSDPFVILPWVSVKSVNILSAIITGPWSYTPTGAIDEIVEFENVRFEGGGIGTVDSTGKTGGQSTFVMIGCVHDAAIICVGRGSGTGDAFLIFDGIDFGGGPLDVTDTFFVMLGGITADAAIRGDTSAIISNVLMVGPLHTFDTATVNANNCGFFAPVEADAGTTITAPSCAFFSTITSNAGAAIDVRGSEILGGSAALVGPGTIDRSITTHFFSPTIIGANPVTFTVPYPNANYNVCATESAGAGGGTTVSVTAKTGAGFDLNDADGGRSFDLTILKE